MSELPRRRFGARVRARDLVPVSQWSGRYRRAELEGDLKAGLTTAVLLVPQAMGLALLAGLPPSMGLYAAFVPVLVYALFGTSRQLAIGPVATDALLVGVALSALAQPGTPQYLTYAIGLAVLVGALQLLMGALRLGFLANFLSRPVISGFSAAAGLVIVANQLTHLLGVKLPRSDRLHEIVHSLLPALFQVHLPTLALGLFALGLLFASKRLLPRFPHALLAVVLGVVATHVFGLDRHGVALLGAVPSGLPVLDWPVLDTQAVLTLLPAAASLAFVFFVEAISVGKQLARAGRYDVRPNQELLALGAANLAGAFFGAHPVSGGLSRSVVHAQAGARTQLAGVVTALCVMTTLLFFTELFATLPLAVVAAVIVSAVPGLIDVAHARRLFFIKRSDFWLLACTFALTLSFGVQVGLLGGVLSALALFLVRSTRPHFAVLGRIPGTEAYLSVERHPHAVCEPGVLVVRIDAQFYFGNVSFLKETLRALADRAGTSLQALVIDASGMNQLDSSAEEALRELDEDLGARGVRLFFSYVKGPVRDVMQRSGLLEVLAREDRIFLRTHHAVARALGAPTHSLPPAPDDPRAPADKIGCGPAPNRAERES